MSLALVESPGRALRFHPPEIYVPAVPQHLRLTDTMICDFIERPDMAAKIIYKENLDEFQKVRLKEYVWTPRVMDSSGLSSAKTRTFFIGITLRRILIGDTWAGIYYPNFSSGQQNFWLYFDLFQRKSPLFRAQIGRVNLDQEVDSKGTKMGPSCWTAQFRNESKVFLPAPGFLTRDAATQAGLRFNDIGVDEWTKIEASGSTGIDDQIIGRCTRESWNQHHPFWRNHNIFLATAEDTLHQGYERYAHYRKEVKKGNPNYSCISFNFKDYSNRPMTHEGKSFKEVLRDALTMKDLQSKWARKRSKFLQEGLGIWSKNGRGWYDGETLDKCVEIGKTRSLTPLIRRDEPGLNDSEDIHYFLGADPAKGEKKKADDGALVMLRAAPVVSEPTDNLADWQLDFVWAYKVRKADAPQWAGIIHWKDRHFRYSGVMLDHGGGGQWIRDELAKEKQFIDGEEKRCIPIVTRDETTVPIGNYCLTMFNRSDEQIKTAWETAKHEDNLLDICHSEFLDGMERGIVGFPQGFTDRSPESIAGWGEERKWANKLLDLARRQLSSISAAVDENGLWLLTSHNARQFESRGRKDFGYACMHAYARFLVWLKNSDRDYQVREEDACGGE